MNDLACPQTSLMFNSGKEPKLASAPFCLLPHTLEINTLYIKHFDRCNVLSSFFINSPHCDDLKLSASMKGMLDPEVTPVINLDNTNTNSILMLALGRWDVV